MISMNLTEQEQAAKAKADNIKNAMIALLILGLAVVGLILLAVVVGASTLP